MSDVEPCVLALHRGSAGPALAPPPMKRCSFFLQALASAFFLVIFLCFPSMGGGDATLLWWRSLCFPQCRSRTQETKIGCLRFCLLVDFIVGCLYFCSLRAFLLLHRVTQVYNPSSFAFLGEEASLSERVEREKDGTKRDLLGKEKASGSFAG